MIICTILVSNWTIENSSLWSKRLIENTLYLKSLIEGFKIGFYNPKLINCDEFPARKHKFHIETLIIKISLKVNCFILYLATSQELCGH